uniref:Uncharacterized protein n=1 Tax=Oryza glumipatula TaxID=40148 RepID=A0A0E0BH10_9ORYZ
MATDGAAAACPLALVPSSHASAIKLPCGVGSFLDLCGKDSDSVPYDFIGGFYSICSIEISQPKCVGLDFRGSSRMGYVRWLGLSVFVAPFLQACSMFHVAANSPHVRTMD